MADLWSTPPFVFLKKSQGSNKESLLELLTPCEEPRLCLKQMINGTDRRKIPLQDEDHLGNDSLMVPGFPHLCSGSFWNSSGVCLYLWNEEKIV